MLTINGKEVRDAKRPIIVRVSKSDIRGAKKRNPASCALARGCLHKGKILSVRIGSHIALLEFEHTVLRYALQHSDTQKIKAFDYAGYFKPDKIKLMPPKVKLGVGTKNHRRPHGTSGKHVSRRLPLRHVWRTA